METQVDGYGNVTSVSRWSYIPTEQVLIPSQIDTATIGFKNDVGRWLVGLPETIDQASRVRDGRTKTLRYRLTYYDTGLLETVERAPDHALDAVDPNTSDENLLTYYARDIYGLVTSVTRSGSSTYLEETIKYDLLDNTFPWTLTDAAGHTEQLTYYSGLGVPAIRIDANNVRTVNYYDGYGRPRYIDKPGLADISISYTSDYSADNIPGQAIVREVAQSENAWRNPREYVVLDRLRRPSRYRWTAFDGTLMTVDVSYDKLGRVESVSVPYQGARPAEWAATRYGYDTLGRLRLVTQPGIYRDSRLIDHEGLTTRSWAEDGTLWYVVEDALGRPVRSADVEPSGREIATTFDYGPFGVLEGVTDPYQHRTSMAYDDLGRRTSLNEPNTGAQRSYFDAFGNLKTFIDGNGNATSYRYDGLHRLYSATGPDGLALSVWDSNDSTGSIGRQLNTEGPDGVSGVHQFDAEGRPQLDGWSVNGEFRRVRFTYDTYGRLQFVEYPDAGAFPGPKIQYFYNDSGYLKEIRSSSPGPFGSEGPLYWRVDSRDGAGRVTGETFGNGVTTRRSYDLAGRQKSIETAGPLALSRPELALAQAISPERLERLRAIQALVYDYGPGEVGCAAVGLLCARHDQLASTTESFEYDSLGRLSEWTVDQSGQRASQTFHYDDVGNLLDRTVVQGPGQTITNSYVGPSGGPYAIKSQTVGDRIASYAYDSAGRQYSGPDRTATYTAFDLPKRIGGKDFELTFLYDALGRRVQKVRSDGTETLYVGRLYERRKTSDGILQHVYKIYGSDRPVAELVWTEVNGSITSRRLYYLHDERLGSVDSVTNDTGEVVERIKYEPFGERRDPATLAAPQTVPYGVIREGFAGHEPDDELRLINMIGRIYDTTTSRFISADPLVSSPLFGQSYNRYAYALNNPLSYLDPLGLEDSRVEKRDGNNDGSFSLHFDIYDSWMTFWTWLKSTFATSGSSAAATGQADKQGSRGAPSEPELPAMYTKYERQAVQWLGEAAKLRQIEWTRQGRDPDTGRPLPPPDPYADIRWELRAGGIARDILLAFPLLLNGAIELGLFDVAVPVADAAGPLADTPLFDISEFGVATKRTRGVLDTGRAQIELTSGLGRRLDLPLPGRNNAVFGHVEARAAQIMRTEDLSEAWLHINRVPCGGKTGCDAMLPHMLPEGSVLHVYGPGGYYKPFRGLLDNPLYPTR
jgi:RHS repeat-associated protein